MNLRSPSLTQELSQKDVIFNNQDVECEASIFTTCSFQALPKRSQKQRETTLGRHRGLSLILITFE